MLAGLIDHLWQSVAFSVIVFGVVYLTRWNSAALQLWLWRIAALKYVLPFSLLFALGGWFGLPVRHSAIPPPPAVTELVSRGLSVAAPAQTFATRPLIAALALVLLAAAAAGCLWFISRQLQRARPRRDAEAARMET